KLRVLVPCIILFIAIILAACGDGSKSEEVLKEQGFTEADSKVTVVTAGQGGTWYGMMGSYADLVNNEIEGTTMNVTPSGGAAENVHLLGDHEAGIGFLTSNYAYDALNATGPFEGEEPMEHFRA